MKPRNVPSSCYSSSACFAPGSILLAEDWHGRVMRTFILATPGLPPRPSPRGEIPIWTNYFGTGGPYCQFYGFLFFYLTGAVNLLFSDLEFSLKFVMGASHVFSGIGMYLFVRTLFNRQAGFIAALAYVMCVWHTQQVLIMGRYPLSVFYCLASLSVLLLRESEGAYA